MFHPGHGLRVLSANQSPGEVQSWGHFRKQRDQGVHIALTEVQQLLFFIFRVGSTPQRQFPHRLLLNSIDMPQPVVGERTEQALAGRQCHSIGETAELNK